jgi:hypothetical protein
LKTVEIVGGSTKASASQDTNVLPNGDVRNTPDVPNGRRLHEVVQESVTHTKPGMARGNSHVPKQTARESSAVNFRDTLRDANEVQLADAEAAIGNSFNRRVAIKKQKPDHKRVRPKRKNVLRPLQSRNRAHNKKGRKFPVTENRNIQLCKL